MTNIPGRKTDARDSQWLAELLAHGLIRPSFVPPQQTRDLRDPTRLSRDRYSQAKESSESVDAGTMLLRRIIFICDQFG